MNLIIFDMDGTIVPSLPIVYESIRRAFDKLGWTVAFTPEEINRFFGVSTASTKGSLYEFITPPHSHLTPDEVRELVRAEFKDAFGEMAVAYPRVKETLASLRRRGYKLAQYTNASTAYLSVIMSALQLRSYYDYVECVHDNNLDKVRLVRKITAHFGGQAAAIVGDRVQDIEAARKTGCLSIGALYGYGDGEAESADIKIEQFSDLLAIFDRRRPVLRRIVEEAGQRKKTDQALVIGVNGIDCAGKTEFAKALEEYLRAQGLRTQVIHIDDFHNPKAVRYAGDDERDNYYNRSFDLTRVVEKLLRPIGEKRDFSTRLRPLNLDTDEYDTVREFVISSDTVVILEGVFLFRKELAPYIDYKVFLDISPDESKRRAQARDPQATADKCDTKYLPAQLRYLEEHPPDRVADMVVDNNNPERPCVKSASKAAHAKCGMLTERAS
ncbi:HAD hydrolase-like protein [candidate division WOR-3 bacterium]|nr:HAD hydrolase-like protein [candidate division WOR-3 bacterium]